MHLGVEPHQSISETRHCDASSLFIDAGGRMRLVAYGAQDVYYPASES